MNNNELSAEDLENVHAGNSYGMSEELAASHPDLFRDSQIEKLKKELGGETELSEDDLQNVHAGNGYGMSEELAASHPDLFRKSQLENMLEENAKSSVAIEEESTMSK